MPISLPSGNVKWEAILMNLGFIEEISAGEVSSGVISLKMPIKAMTLNETI